MADIKQFPHKGYDVVLVKKDDILNTIEQNIIDREIMDELITTLEFDLNNYLKSEVWAGVPFLGSIRIPPGKLFKKKTAHLRKEAFDNMSKEEYVMFYKDMSKEADRVIRSYKMYRWLASLAINKNIKYFRAIAKVKGEKYARLRIYFLSMVKSVENNFLILDEYGITEQT